MAKAVVMQVTDIKNRRQDMNIRQTLSIAADLVRPLRRANRILPKTWMALVFASCLAVPSLPAFAAQEQQPAQVRPDSPLAAQFQALPPSAILTPGILALNTLPSDGQQQSRKTDPVQGQQPVQAEEAPARNGLDDQGRAAWRELEKGLWFGEFQLNDGYARLTVVRIDPAFFDFTLCARSQDNGPSRPLNQWGEQYNLSAAINASMYLPDGSTSTGYMRQGEHTNNGRIVQRFGAFFVAGPDEPGLPLAAIIDRDNPVWRQQLDRYSLVIQNYRMINADRRILWAPGGPHYSISAVAQDGEGQILFMHCRQPVEAYSFAQQVLHLPLNVRTVMYVEGGGQAGLLVRSAALTRELVGLSPTGLLVTGDLRAVLPNVLGARRKDTPATEAATSAQPDSAAAPAAESPAAAAEPPADGIPADSIPQAAGPQNAGPEAPTAQVPQTQQPDGKPEGMQPATDDAPTTTVPDNSAAPQPAGPGTPAPPTAETTPRSAAGQITEPLTEPGTPLAAPAAGAEKTAP